MDTKALRNISYGMYVVTSRMGDKVNGQIANTIIQTTSEPPRIAVCINKQNLTHAFIQDSGVFAASVLSEATPMTFIGQFGFKSGRDGDKFQGCKVRGGATGAPIVLDHAIAYVEARVIGQLDTGTHTLFLGEVIGGENLDAGTPMTYAYYHLVKGGKSPKAAPTFVQDAPVVPAPVAQKARYSCSVCGYVYDPDVGDPDGGVPAGTAFEDLPADWTCPVCGAQKADFQKIA